MTNPLTNPRFWCDTLTALSAGITAMLTDRGPTGYQTARPAAKLLLDVIKPSRDHLTERLCLPRP